MAERRVGMRVLLSVSALMLLVGAGTAWAAFDLTGSGSVTVTPPTVSASFVSGKVGALPCAVLSGGNGLTCPSVSFQAQTSTLLIFTITNTGSISVTLNISVTPVNASVLTVSSVYGSPLTLQPEASGTYSFELYGLSSGNSAFNINVTPTS